MSVGTPARLPLSTSAFFTHSRSVCAVQPILVAIETTAAHRDWCSCSWSRTSRTARERTSGENLLLVCLLMAPLSQVLEPPANPERFTTIRQQQSGELYYADSGGPVYGATGLSWSKSVAADWAANYFSISALQSNPGTIATTTLTYDNNGNVIAVGTTTFYTYDYQNRLIQSDIWNG